jgi:hypothetical protein
MSHRLTFTTALFLPLTLTLGAALGVWYGKSQVDASVKAEVASVIEEEFASRQAKLDESIHQQIQPLFDRLESAVREAQKLQPISQSGPGILDRPPVENIDALLRHLAYHFRFRRGTFVINERTLISDDVGSGAMFLISYRLDNNAVNNCTELVVLSPKPYDSYPHNPPAIMSARYIDPASSLQIAKVRYEVEFTNDKVKLYATVETFGIQDTPLTGTWSYAQMLAN